MKVLIDDGMQIRYGTGIGRYTQYLYEEYKKIVDIDVELSEYRSLNNKFLSRIRYLLYINSKAFMDRCETFNIIHFTNFVIPFRRTNKKYAVTIHDLSAFSSKNSFTSFSSLYYRYMIKYSIKHADLIITVSDTMKREIIKMFPRCTDKIRVCYSGVVRDNATKVVRKISDSKLHEKRFFLFVGTIEKRKNLDYVIKAFIQMKQESPEYSDFKLCLAGREGYGANELHLIVDNSIYKDDIIFTGYVSDEFREELYENALAFIFPSSYEGFGVPQLECMKYNLPSLLSDIPIMHEISGNYGDYFSLENHYELSSLMKKYARKDYDLSAKQKIAREKVAFFTWEKVAKLHESAYAGILGDRNENN